MPVSTRYCDIVDYDAECVFSPGAVLGGAQHEEVPSVQRHLTQHPAGVWWSRPPFLCHQGHQEEPQLP